MPTPLENFTPLVIKAKRTPSSSMFTGSPLLGWQCMVAPTNKNALQGYTCGNGTTQVGAFSRLPSSTDASYKMAPHLSDIIRQSLEGKQISVENITHHLNSIKSMQRYDKAFKLLWAFMTEHHVDPLTCSVEEVAIILVRMGNISLHDARNAYAACILIPQLDSLRFSKTLQKTKRLWNFHPQISRVLGCPSSFSEIVPNHHFMEFHFSSQG